MPHNFYVAIEGVIGVGKTTLARLAQPLLNAQLLLEVFEENPFLADFYADPAKYAFQTQIFFLLSRYQQQHQTVQRLLHSGNLISDYTFSKDRLFAHLNLAGNEVETYERLHRALAENVTIPDLIVYLKADTPALMQRIAARDRPYERGMSPEYIERLRSAYDAFFSDYAEAPVLVIDSNHLDVVRNREHLAEVVQRVRSALGEGTHQVTLPEFTAPAAEGRELATVRRRLADLQRWHRLVDSEAGSSSDPYLNLIRFQGAVGELANYMAQVWTLSDSLHDKYGNSEEALDAALRDRQRELQDRLVGCLMYILRLSNRVGIDLESAYLHHMRALDAKNGQEGQA